MNGAARSAATLGGLAALVVVATVWGWAAFTEPLPKDEPVPICVNTAIPSGTEVRRDQVVVSVYNGSRRSGLASTASDELAERGFVAGAVGNAPQPSPGTRIWSDDPTNPAVDLVRQQFKGAKVVPGDALGPGVVVILGEKYQSLKKKQVESVVAQADATYCQATASDPLE
ncbi:LytR C-terminal domain-containing protein [Nocardioides hwasunensis]|uniref:LytR C-terminal domain-containing protein n=1 Tax=Nocardioides hwasunensis TaxID=397258 RepID=A0ABR8MM58_9ACTN|nr:LytR C-terminal domain-containing protein [Nocardioides hwasunensis]MBD3917108.1 LytR C-terminal domain-containing protein [Nocardioides hwasunensis]